MWTALRDGRTSRWRCVPCAADRPSPADFPVVLLAVDGSGAPDQWRVHVPDITCVDVGGNHASVLHTPHVDAVARYVQAGRERDPALT